MTRDEALDLIESHYGGWVIEDDPEWTDWKVDQLMHNPLDSPTPVGYSGGMPAYNNACRITVFGDDSEARQCGEPGTIPVTEIGVTYWRCPVHAPAVPRPFDPSTQGA